MKTNLLKRTLLAIAAVFLMTTSVTAQVLVTTVDFTPATGAGIAAVEPTNQSWQVGELVLPGTNTNILVTTPGTVGTFPWIADATWRLDGEGDANWAFQNSGGANRGVGLSGDNAAGKSIIWSPNLPAGNYRVVVSGRGRTGGAAANEQLVRIGTQNQTLSIVNGASATFDFVNASGQVSVVVRRAALPADNEVWTIRVYTLDDVGAETEAVFESFSVNGNAITSIPAPVDNAVTMGRSLVFGSFSDPINVTFGASRNAWITMGVYNGNPADTTTVTSPFSHTFVPGTPVTFNVTAEDGQTTNVYTVTLTEEPAVTDLLTFELNGITVTPNAAGMIFNMPFGMDRSALTATFTSSPLTTVTVGGEPVVSGDVFDFLNPVTFRVNAPDMSSHTDYTVTVRLAQPALEPTRLHIGIANEDFPHRLGGVSNGVNNLTTPAGDGLFFTATNALQANSDMAACNMYRLQVVGSAGVVIRVGSTPADMIVIWGNSSGGAARTISAFETSTSQTGPWTAVDGATPGTQTWMAGPTANNNGCHTWTIEDINITPGTYVRVLFNDNFRLAGVDLYNFAAPGTDANALAFYVGSERGIIDREERTITVEFPYGTATPLASMPVEFVVSRAATVVFAGTARPEQPFPFTFVDGTPVNMVVTAQAGGASHTYEVTVSVEDIPNTNFLTFMLNDTEVDVATLHNSSTELPYTGTDLSALAVYFTTARNVVVTVDGSSDPITTGAVLNFTNPRTFTVRSTVNASHYSTFTVAATRRLPSRESTLLTFTVNNFVGVAPAAAMTAEVPFATFMDAIRVTFTTSDFATVYVGSTAIESGAELDFTSGPITFRVVAEIGGSYYTEHTVTITERAAQGQILAWDFRNWTDATLANLAADAVWIANAENNRFHTSEVRTNMNPVTANGTPIRELAGLRFNATAHADRLRVDHAHEFNRLGLNGGNTPIPPAEPTTRGTELIIPGLTAGQYIAITFATPTAAETRWLVPINATTVSESYTTTGGNSTPAWVVYQVTANGDVSFAASNGGMNIMRITVSNTMPLSEDTRFLTFAAVFDTDTVSLTPTVGGVTHTFPFGTDPAILEDVEVIFTLGHEDAEASIDGTEITSPHTQDFTDSPVTFRVTAAAGNHTDYPVSIVIGNPEAFMLSFAANGLDITPNPTMSQLMPFDVNLAAVAITFTASYGATVTVGGNAFTSGNNVDFSAGAVTFTVTSATTAGFTTPVVRNYVVTLTPGIRPSFATFIVNDVAATTLTPGAPGEIFVPITGSTTDLLVEFTTVPVDAVVRVGTHIVNAAREGHIQSFTNPVTYTITDEVTGTVVTYIVTVSDPASIQDGLGTLEIVSFYPNPTTDILNVTANNLRTIEIINMMGTVVLSTPASGNTHTLDVSSLSAGLHFIRVTTDTGITVGRFIKQ